MRTNKIKEDSMTITEWNKIYEDHYSLENQHKRIDEVEEFLTSYLKNSFEMQGNKRATFDGVFAYLDIHKECVEDFKTMIHEVALAFASNVDFDDKEHELVFTKGELNGEFIQHRSN